MTGPERRKADYERHRAFLSSVTGLSFDPPYLDAMRGLVFQSEVKTVRTPRGPLPLMLESVICGRAEFYA